MTSPVAVAFSFTSQSGTSLRDAVISYRRSQMYLSDSVSASASGEEDLDQDSLYDEEASLGSETPEAPNGQLPELDTSVIGQWEDDDLTPGPSAVDSTFILPASGRRGFNGNGTSVHTLQPREPHESTPLLRKTTSLSFLERAVPPRTETVHAKKQPVRDGHSALLVRRSSQSSTQSRLSARIQPVAPGKGAMYAPPGKSTFGQTLFNAIAILLGIGTLSEPLAFAYAGWAGGSLLIVFYGLITCYTAKILAHIIFSDPKLKSYADIGRKAFGRRSVPWINALFCLELFTVGVALVTLYADSLHSVVPAYSSTFYKIIGIFVLVPTMIMPLSVLSYASMIGILSTLLIVAVVFIDGFSKSDYPGSLWHPAPTSFGISGLGELGISFGLFMAGFSGHAVIPALARDMIDPSQFDDMIDYAFLIATTIYAVIGAAGYLMFGAAVSDEFSRDLMSITAYNPLLNKIALWGLVLSPLSKYALATSPLAMTVEVWLGIDIGAFLAEEHGPPSKPISDGITPSFFERHQTLKHAFVTVERVAFVFVSVAVSILVPEFSSMMAFLGAFFAFFLCVIGPVAAKIALAGGKADLLDGGLLLITTVMAIWGTGAAFWSTT